MNVVVPIALATLTSALVILAFVVRCLLDSNHRLTNAVIAKHGTELAHVTKADFRPLPRRLPEVEGEFDESSRPRPLGL